MAPAMLLASAGTVGALAITHAAWTFVTLLLVSVVLALGAWPVLVEGALARVPPAERFRMAIAWNMREFTVIAVATAGGGYLVHSGGAPTLLLGIAAVLLLAAAIGAAAMLRRPLHEPRGTRTGGRAPLEETFPHVVHHPNSFQPAPPRPTDTP